MPPVSPASIDWADCPVDYVMRVDQPAMLTGDESGWRSAYTFGVALEDQDAFCLFLTANVVEIDLGGGSSATRILPAPDPYRAELLCQRIECRAVGGWTPTNPEPLRNWSHAEVRAEFGSVPYPTDGSTPFMTIRSRATPEATTVAGRKLTFPDGTPISADAAYVYPVEQHSITIYNAPDTPAADATLTATYSGTVNNATFLSIYPAYTIRFDGMDREVVRTTTNVVTVTKTIHLSYRAIDWRKALKSDGTWDFVVRPGGSYQYTTANYNALVQ